MRKIIVLILIVLFSFACATIESRNLVMPKFEKIKLDTFNIGQIQQKTIGESMIEQTNGIVKIYDGFKIINNFTPPSAWGVNYPTIYKDTYWIIFAKLDNEDKILQNETISRPTVLGDPVKWDYCLVVNSLNEPYGDTNCIMIYVREWSEKPQNFLIPEKKHIYQKGSFKRELIYNGKSKEMLKLQYREYTDDLARPAFYQDLIYDLTESKEIGFKGMIIEVIEATNSYIKFFVKSGM